MALRRTSSDTTTSRGRRLGVSAALALTLAGASIVGLAPAAHANSSDNAQFLAHLNALRASHGLRPLVLNAQLNSVATAWAGQLVRMSAKTPTLEHNPNLGDDVSNWQFLGENVGYGPDAASIDTAFDQSPPHYANEVDANYTEVGIGTAYDSRDPAYLYVTVDFEKPMSATTPVITTVVKAPVTTPTVVVHPASATTAVVPRTEHHVVTAKKAAVKLTAKVTPKPVTPQPPAPRGTDPLAEAIAFNQTVGNLPG